MLSLAAQLASVDGLEGVVLAFFCLYAAVIERGAINVRKSETGQTMFKLTCVGKTDGGGVGT